MYIFNICPFIPSASPSFNYVNQVLLEGLLGVRDLSVSHTSKPAESLFIHSCR